MFLRWRHSHLTASPPSPALPQPAAGLPASGKLKSDQTPASRGLVGEGAHRDRGGSDQLPPSAPSIALSAASAFEPSGPPACAMSARPPPPFPPSASAPLRTRSMAEKRDVRSSVTPTTTPALPSSVTPTMATTPEPRRFLPSSDRKST